MGRRHTCTKKFKKGKPELSEKRKQTIKHKNTKAVRNLRPHHSLEDSVQLVWTEAVGIEAVKEILGPQEAEPPQILERTDATCPQLQIKRCRMLRDFNLKIYLFSFSVIRILKKNTPTYSSWSPTN